MPARHSGSVYVAADNVPDVGWGQATCLSQCPLAEQCARPLRMRETRFLSSRDPRILLYRSHSASGAPAWRGHSIPHPSHRPRLTPPPPTCRNRPPHLPSHQRTLPVSMSIPPGSMLICSPLIRITSAPLSPAPPPSGGRMPARHSGSVYVAADNVPDVGWGQATCRSQCPLAA